MLAILLPIQRRDFGDLCMRIEETGKAIMRYFVRSLSRLNERSIVKTTCHRAHCKFNAARPVSAYFQSIMRDIGSDLLKLNHPNVWLNLMIDCDF